jgi:putative hydrolase of HD superfamily
MHDPRTVIDRQLAAYNDRDPGRWLATYAADAEQLLADGTPLARGHAQMHERMRGRFADPHLHAALLHRIVVGDTVVDHERVTRSGPGGMETVEMVCVYAVRGGEIVRATFAFGEPVPLSPART